MLDLRTIEYLSRQYQEDRLLEANGGRGLRRAPRRIRQHRLIRRVLVRLGNRLVAWGQRLQEQHEGGTAAPAFPACSPTR